MIFGFVGFVRGLKRGGIGKIPPRLRAGVRQCAQLYARLMADMWSASTLFEPWVRL